MLEYVKKQESELLTQLNATINTTRSQIIDQNIVEDNPMSSEPDLGKLQQAFIQQQATLFEKSNENVGLSKSQNVMNTSGSLMSLSRNNSGLIDEDRTIACE